MFKLLSTEDFMKTFGTHYILADYFFTCLSVTDISDDQGTCWQQHETVHKLIEENQVFYFQKLVREVYVLVNSSFRLLSPKHFSLKYYILLYILLALILCTFFLAITYFYLTLKIFATRTFNSLIRNSIKIKHITISTPLKGYYVFF